MPGPQSRGAPAALTAIAAAAMVTSCAPQAGGVPASPPTTSAPARSASSRGCGTTATIADHDRHYTLPIDPALANGASQRTAVVHIPSTYQPGRPAPLVMEFHGAGSNATADGYKAASPLRALSDT